MRMRRLVLEREVLIVVCDANLCWEWGRGRVGRYLPRILEVIS
jgi:hypothetical protein